MKRILLMISSILLLNFSVVNIYAQDSDNIWFSCFDEDSVRYDLNTWGNNKIDWSNFLMYPIEKKYLNIEDELYDPGEKVIRMISFKNNNGDNTYFRGAAADLVLPNIDYRKLALDFWIYPYFESDNYEIGLTCWGNLTNYDMTGEGDPKNEYTVSFSVVKISLTDYVGQIDTNRWTHVIIPLEDIVKGEFDCATDVNAEFFDTARINGLYFGAKINNPDEVNSYIEGTDIALLDKVSFVKYISTPTEMNVGMNNNSVELDWEGVKSPHSSDIVYEITEYTPKMEKLSENVTNNGVKLSTYIVTSEIDSENIYSTMQTGTSTKETDSLFSSFALSAKGNNSSIQSVGTLMKDSLMSLYFKIFDASNSAEVPQISAYGVDFGDRYVVSWNKSDEYDAYVLKFGDVIVAVTENNSAIFETKPSGTVTLYAYNEDTGSLSAAVVVEGKDASKQIEVSDVTLMNGETELLSLCDDKKFDKCILKTENYTHINKDVEITLSLYRYGELIDTSKTVCEIPYGNAVVEIDNTFYTAIPGEYQLKATVGSNQDNQLLESTFVLSGQTADIPQYEIIVGDKTYQTVDGFGVNLQGTVIFQDKYFSDIAENPDNPNPGWKPFEDIINNSGITVTRLFVETSSIKEWENIDPKNESTYYDENFYNQVVTGVKYNKAHNILKYTMTMGDPPASWGLSQRDSWQDCPEKIDVFAAMAVKALKIIYDEGLPLPIGMSILNEPNYISKEAYAKLVLSFRKALDAVPELSEVKIIGFDAGNIRSLIEPYYELPQISSTCPYDPWLKSFMENTPEAKQLRDAIDVIGTHSYTGNRSDSDYSPDIVMQKKREVQRKLEKPSWQTEYSVWESMGYTTENYDFKEAYKWLENNNIDSLIRELQVFAGDLAWGESTIWLHHTPYSTHASQLSYPGDAKDKATVYLPGILKPQSCSMMFGRPGYDDVEFNNIYYALTKIFKNVPAGSKVKRIKVNNTEGSGLDLNCGRICDGVAFEYTGQDGQQGSVTVVINDTKNDMILNYKGIYGDTAEVYSVGELCDEMLSIGNFEVSDTGEITSVYTPAMSVNIIVASVQ